MIAARNTCPSPFHLQTGIIIRSGARRCRSTVDTLELQVACPCDPLYNQRSYTEAGKEAGA